MEILRHFMEVLAQPMGLIGLLGQLLFTCRFLAQWVVSEKKGESVVPVVFWYLSFGGGVLLLIYALWRKDPVITLGQIAGLVVYARNLVLIRRQRRREGLTPSPLPTRE